PLQQDGARVPRAQLQGRHGPGGDHQAGHQVPARGRSDGCEEH
ncbi:hypothetical protein BN1723_020466, partial [Verticillium longisporum]